MQPYVFPYIGYFNLVHACDTFVFLDDVTFRKQSWINRNRILIEGRPFRFTVPVRHASSNTLILQTELHGHERFREKFLRQLRLSYRKAAYFDLGYCYVRDVLNSDPRHVGELAMRSVEAFCGLLGMKRDFRSAAALSPAAANHDRSDRLISIVSGLGGTRYVNAMGGAALYDKAHFHRHGIDLKFVNPALKDYPQHGAGGFVPGLSVIDLLMNVPRDDILAHIADYSLI